MNLKQNIEDQSWIFFRVILGHVNRTCFSKVKIHAVCYLSLWQEEIKLYDELNS